MSTSPLDRHACGASAARSASSGSLGVLLALLARAAADRRRAIGWPVLLGLLALACGIWAVTRGERRLGWGAVAAASSGSALGIARDRSPSVGNLDRRLRVGADRRDAPLRDAARLRGHRRPVLRAQRRREHRPRGDDADGRVLRHLRRRQVRLAGSSGSLVAMVAGGALALVHAFFSIHLRADQIVGGTAINFLALGITGYLVHRDLRRRRASPTTSRRSPTCTIPDLGRTGGSSATGVRRPQPDDLAELRAPDPRRTSSSSGRRSGCASAPSASTRARPTRSGSRSTGSATAPSIISGVLAALGGAYLSIGFVHSSTRT